MLKTKIKKLYEDSIVPEKMSEEAGALDIYCHRVDIKDGVFVCYTGIAMTPPKGYRIALVPRSSLSKYSYVLGNHYGVGDRDFTGEYQFRFRPINTNKGEILQFPYNKGDRIGQMFLEKVIDFEFEEVDSLEETKRGDGGYGSTGGSGGTLGIV